MEAPLVHLLVNGLTYFPMVVLGIYLWQVKRNPTAGQQRAFKWPWIGLGISGVWLLGSSLVDALK